MAIDGLPSAIESEVYILGAMIQDPEAVALASRSLKVEDFFEPAHQAVYEVMLSLLSSRERFDTPTVARALEERGQLERVGGLTMLASLIDAAYATANADFHVKAVVDAAVRRNMIIAAREMLQRAQNISEPVQDVLDKAQATIFDIGRSGEHGGFRHASELMQEVNLEIKAAQERGKGELRGLSTGYSDLNDKLAGLQQGDLIIVAARPSAGKTAFCLNLARNAAVDGGTAVAIFSLEMSSTQLGLRLVCQQARVNMHKAISGDIDTAEEDSLRDAMNVLGQSRLYIDDSSPLTATEMIARSRRLASKLDGEGQRLGMVVVDYLQLMRSSEAREQRRLEVAEFSRGLKRLARQLEVPVIAACQLGRSAEKEKGKSRRTRRPQLADLYESDAIGQDADVVMFLHAQEMEDEEGEMQDSRLNDAPVVEVVIGKHRNGPTGIVPLLFLKNIGRFEMTENDYLQERQALANLGDPFM